MNLRELKHAYATAQDTVASAMVGEDNVAEIAKARASFDTAAAALREAQYGNGADALPADRVVTGLDAGESAAVRRLRSQVSLSDYVNAAIAGRGPKGAAEELNQELGLQPGRFPLDMFAGRDYQAASVDGDSGATQSSWLDVVFAGSAADHLGITRTPVAPGTATFPAVTSVGVPQARGREQSGTTRTQTLSVTEMKPSRITLHIRYASEDALRLAGMGDALGRSMNGAVMEYMDRSVFLGDSTPDEDSADIAGLLGLTGVDEVTLTQANKVKADKTLEELVGFVDGKYAGSLGDLSVVNFVGCNKLWGSTIHNSAASNQTIGQFLQASGVSWRTRGDIEGASSNGKYAAAFSLANGLAGAARIAVWRGAEMIRDPYSGANAGQVRLTVNAYWNFAVVRGGNFRTLKFVT